MLVDTGSEYTWAPTQSLEKIGIGREKKDVLFVMANGQQGAQRWLRHHPPRQALHC